MLISDWYRKEQAYLHTEHPNRVKYGSGGPQWVEQLQEIAREHGCHSMIDYGCGKAVLVQRNLLPEFEIQCYDPALAEFSNLPSPADLVACMDVLEHIEPNCLNSVMDHLIGLANKLIFVSVSLQSAGRTLRDGRNSHLIVKPREFWVGQFTERGCAVEREYEPRREIAKRVGAIPEWVALIRAPNKSCRP